MKKTFLMFILFSGLFGIKKADAQYTPYIGHIIAVPYNFAPRGWAACEGQLLPISQNTALFSLLGTTYGGNGTTNFALPDLRGRMAVGQGQGPGLSMVNAGANSGSATTSLNSSHLPAHSHEIPASSAAGTSSLPAGNVVANTSDNDKEFSSGANSNMSPSGSVGSGSAFSTMQPHLGMYYIIALTGLFPSRP